MGREVVIIVAEGCQGCHELVERLQKENAQVRILDVTKSLEAAQIVKDLGIKAVPTLVTVEKTETGTKFCMVDEKGSKCVEAKR